jgi:glycosidase
LFVEGFLEVYLKEGIVLGMEKHRIVIYQLLPRLFGNTGEVNKYNGTILENGCGKFNDITDKALKSIADLGATHVWYTGIIEHATCTDYSEYGISKDFPDVVKGNAGSPYAIKDYYDVDPDLAVDIPNRLKEFEQLISRSHSNGLKVIIDLIPNHLARNYMSDAAPEGTEPFGFNDDETLAFKKDNNYYYLPDTSFISPVENFSGERWKEVPARVTGNDCFSHAPAITDWYETVKLNYGVDYINHTHVEFDPVPDTWLKMRDVVKYWAEKGVDGFRCDMAGMVPIGFWRWLIGEVRESFPESLFIAEVYEADQYHDFIFKGGFDYLYDKVVLYDKLRAVIEGKAPATEITRCWQHTDGLHSFLLYFLENHDEQRIASDFFAGSGIRAFPGMVVAATMFNNPLLIYFGQELGEPGMDEEGFSGRDGRTTIFDYRSIDSIKKWNAEGSWSVDNLDGDAAVLRKNYAALLNLLNEKPALFKGRFYDLMWDNRDNPEYNSDKLFAFLRYEGNRFFLVIANFSEGELSYKLKIPEGTMNHVGMDGSLFYTGTDLLEMNRKILFPGSIAMNGGFGGRIAGYSASVYELIADALV